MQELVLQSSIRRGRGASAQGTLALPLMFLMLGVAGAGLTGNPFPLGAGLVAAVWMWNLLRGKATSPVTLQYISGVLIIDGDQPTLSTALEDLIDVELDTKTVAPMRDGTTVAALGGMHNPQATPEFDTARIVLVVGEHEHRYPLTEAYLSHTEAVEWLSKTRVFLRKHGWLPNEERV